MMARSERPTGRDAQREETRKRVYEAALEEFRRSGMAAADVGKIVAAAGVARGTFYFHFPTKEHVLAELERREETRMAGLLSTFLDGEPDLAAVFGEVVRLFLAMERRVGKPLFRELLALHFSPSRPDALPGTDEPAAYPAITLMMRAIEHAKETGEVYDGAHALQTAGFFMLGLYALLITSQEQPRAARAEMIGNFTATVLRGLEAR
jgi:TetR/AcrR family transcriptional regulator, repressor for uid operon